MHLWSKTCERVKDLKQEKMDCVKHAGFKHARFHSAFTPTLIPLTSTGTGLIYSIVNSQNESCRWSLAEHLIFSRQAPLGLFRAMPLLAARCLLWRFAGVSSAVLKPSAQQRCSHTSLANSPFTSSSFFSELFSDEGRLLGNLWYGSSWSALGPNCPAHWLNTNPMRTGINMPLSYFLSSATSPGEFPCG